MYGLDWFHNMYPGSIRLVHSSSLWSTSISWSVKLSQGQRQLYKFHVSCSWQKQAFRSLLFSYEKRMLGSHHPSQAFFWHDNNHKNDLRRQSCSFCVNLPLFPLLMPKEGLTGLSMLRASVSKALFWYDKKRRSVFARRDSCIEIVPGQLQRLRYWGRDPVCTYLAYLMHCAQS